MLYLERFQLPNRRQEEDFFAGVRRTCHTTFYPFQVFYQREPGPFTFTPVTIFCGGNGSGKSTLLHVIAETVGAARSAPCNRSEFYGEYVKRCSFTMRGGQTPAGSRIITSDDVFDYLLELRAFNQSIDLRRGRLLEEYLDAKYGGYQFRSLEDHEALRRKVAARSKSQSQFVRGELVDNVREGSNGESALRYFTEEIREDALYLLDEPENSLSAQRQLELKRFLEDSARFYGCQLILATHSPFLLAMEGARIYDLDHDPVEVRPWTQLETVRTYFAFFQAHREQLDDGAEPNETVRRDGSLSCRGGPYFRD